MDSLVSGSPASVSPSARPSAPASLVPRPSPSSRCLICPNPAIKDWCTTHGCSKPGCEAPGLCCIPIEQYSNYSICYQHKCRVKECERYSFRSGFCDLHTESKSRIGPGENSSDSWKSQFVVNKLVEEQIIEHKKSNSLPPNFFQRREEFVGKLEKLIREKIPDAKLTMFGSTVTGIVTKDSDVDISVSGASIDSPRNPTDVLLEIQEWLKENKITTVLINARVPILQFKRTKTRAFYVHPFDLCIGNEAAVRNSWYVAAIMKYDNRIKTLASVIKRWAKESKFLNSNKGFTAYALSLLLIFFCCRTELPLVPWVEPCAKPVWPPKGTPNTKTISRLLFEFFVFIHDFDWENNAISLRLGKSVLKQELSFAEGDMIIEDPFNSTFNCTRFIKKSFITSLRRCARIQVNLIANNHLLSFSSEQFSYLRDEGRVQRVEPPSEGKVQDVPRLVAPPTPPIVSVNATEIEKEHSVLVYYLKFFDNAYFQHFNQTSDRSGKVGGYFQNEVGGYVKIQKIEFGKIQTRKKKFNLSSRMSTLYKKHQALEKELSGKCLEDQIIVISSFYGRDPNIFKTITQIHKHKPDKIDNAGIIGPSPSACLTAPRKFLLKLERILRNLELPFEHDIQEAQKWAKEGRILSNLKKDIEVLLKSLDGFFQNLFKSPEIWAIQKKVAPSFDVLARKRHVLFESPVFVVGIGRSYCVLFNDTLLLSSLERDEYRYFILNHSKITDEGELLVKVFYEERNEVALIVFEDDDSKKKFLAV